MRAEVDADDFARERIGGLDGLATLRDELRAEMSEVKFYLTALKKDPNVQFDDSGKKVHQIPGRASLSTCTKADLEEVLNLSVNQTLARTVLTSGTTLAALLALYFLGGEVIRPFAFAMLIGVAVGTYSSIYIASPLLLLLEGRQGREASAS